MTSVDIPSPSDMEYRPLLVNSTAPALHVMVGVELAAVAVQLTVRVVLTTMVWFMGDDTISGGAAGVKEANRTCGKVLEHTIKT